MWVGVCGEWVLVSELDLGVVRMYVYLCMQVRVQCRGVGIVFRI